MKKCVHQRRYGRCKIRCTYTGAIKGECPIRHCRYFRPTLRFRLFGKWW